MLRSMKLFLFGLLLQGMLLFSQNARNVVWVFMVRHFISWQLDLFAMDLCKIVFLFYFWDVCSGGYFHGRHNLTYGVDVHRIRWLGVLQVAFMKFQFNFFFFFTLLGSSLIFIFLTLLGFFHRLRIRNLSIFFPIFFLLSMWCPFLLWF